MNELTMQLDTTSRANPWAQTFTGLKIHPRDPSPDEITLEDIARGLANTCRFSGQCRRFYSVAQHSVLVSHLVPQEHAMQGLMHDAAEAYIGDITRPIKMIVPVFSTLEDRVLGAIAAKFGFDRILHPEVHRADSVALATETVALGMDTTDWDLPEPPAPIDLVPVGPRAARRIFMRRFARLVLGLTSGQEAYTSKEVSRAT